MFPGQRVLVTGPGREIGRAIARRFAQGRAWIQLAARSCEELWQAGRRRRTGAVSFFPSDLGGCKATVDVDGCQNRRRHLWKFRENRIAVSFQYDWHDADRQWYRSYGTELWNLMIRA
jgi:hypothetical protein